MSLSSRPLASRPLAPKPLGIALLVIGIGCFIGGGLIAWGGVNGWLASGYLTTANDKAGAGDASGARASARDALALMPSAPAAVLAAADLSTPANAEALLSLMRGASSRERATLAAAAGLANGKAPEGGEANASDTALLVAIGVKSPGPVALNKDSPPHRAVLAAWAATRLAAAFAAKQPDDVWQSACMLLTLAPKHPQKPELLVISAGLDPTGVNKPALIAAIATINDRERSQRLGVALLSVRPERNELRLLLPGAGNPATESANALARLVAIVKATPDKINEGAVIRCLQAGKMDLADELIAVAPAAKQPALTQLSDLLGGGDFAKSAPQISTPMIIGGQMSFHLSTAQGALPTAKITVRIGTTEVPAETIRRIGTLITLPLKANGPQAVTVTYDGKPVYAANLSL